MGNTLEEHISGEELFRRFQSGDDHAFDELVALYEDELFRFINSIVNDHHEAKHLMIESFARLAVGGGRFSGKSSLKTYLFTIGKNLALRYVKMRGRERHVPYLDVVETLVSDEEAPDAAVEREEDKRLLKEAMGGLKESHRAVLVLLYFEDMSYIQAGLALHKSEAQVRGLAHRAKIALKTALEEKGYVR